MTRIAEALDHHVELGAIPGAVALVAAGDDVDVTVCGDQAVGGAAMRPDSVFRIASAGKPITAAAVLALVADGSIALDAPVAELLPELAEPEVLVEPTAELDQTVPANRPVTVVDLLRSTSGIGLPSDLSTPIATELFEHHHQGPPRPDERPSADEWMAGIGRLPLVHQPGEGFTYNTSYDVLGVLVERASGQRFDRYVVERILRPLGMFDTGFVVPPNSVDRMTSLYRLDGQHQLDLVDGPSGAWAERPAFASGAGGYVSTAIDLLAFHGMLLAGGGDVLPSPLVVAMTSDQLTPGIRATNPTFLDDQSWGFGGGVDITENEPWHAPGRYGWVGGTGTSAYHVRSDGSVAILLTQVELGGPDGAAVLESFWTAAAEQLGYPRSA